MRIMEKQKWTNQQGKEKSKMREVLTTTSTKFCALLYRKSIFYLTLLAFLSLTSIASLMAQCALCTKTAQQLGDGPAAGLNKGILYLMGIPLCILSIVGYKWYKKEKINRTQEDNA